MRVDQIKRLVELVEKSEIDELEVREWGRSIRIAKRAAGAAVFQPVETPVMVTPQPAPLSPALSETASPAGAADDTPMAETGLIPILSPMVGTFYRAASPPAASFVDVGERVTKGQTVCIIEAMKLMNEIESETAGTIVEVLLKNEEPVEFNQPLFMVRPD